MTDTNIFNEIWKLGLSILDVISKAWDWLTTDIVINITWLRIPLLAPDGVFINTGLSVFGLLTGSILLFLAFKVVKAIIPFL